MKPQVHAARNRTGTRLVRELFFRALGGVYLSAFSSLSPQVRGLYGSRGIRPVEETLTLMRGRLPSRTDRLRRVPTLFWLDASDATLVRACRAGQVASAFLVLGIAPRASATAAWALYLSFVSVGREFLQYQWDALLLETGAHAIVIAPGRKRDVRTSRVAVAAMRWLALRLQFESGHCKLASGDKTWRDGSACVVHFETQPLPTRESWYMHQLPHAAKRALTYVALGIELAGPVLAVSPRRVRRGAFTVLSALQLAIEITGNYGFFNVLTVVNNLWLLDDGTLARTPRQTRSRPPSRLRRWLTALALAPLVATSVGLFVERLFRKRPAPRSIEKLTRLQGALAPFHAVSPYGLFAMMTTERPEIVVEGSDDGVTWREYGFRYKVGDVARPPRRAAPHQPRLDWQMWFAALGFVPSWFLQFLRRLLEASPDVLALLEHDPFGGQRPRFVRALLYDYKMTDRETRQRTGAWWQREALGTYVPPIELPAAKPS